MGLWALELLCSGIVFSDYKKRPLGLILLLLMILMGFEVGTKKPLCINSKIVNKIDRIALAEDASSGGNLRETLYSCSTYKIPKFSTYFYENLSELNSRINKIEKIAALLGLSGQMDFEINELTTGQLKLKDNKIVISADRLNDPEVDKLFVTVLLLQNMKFESAQFSGFLAGWLIGQASNDSALEEIWNDSFESLNTVQQFSFKEALYSDLRTRPEFTNRSLSENMLALLNSEKPSVQKFKTVFLERMARLGISDNNAVADLVFENQSGKVLDSANLIALARRHKDKRIVLEDASGTYVLPYLTKLDEGSKSQVKTKLRVLLVGNENNLNVVRYFKNTDKLIVFKAGGNATEPSFSGLFASTDLTKNELAFLNANKKLDFIQFHVPSLEYSKTALLDSVQNYFGLLKNAKATANTKKLGWQSVEWSIEAQAFKPIAVYDVIQYYRIN